MDDTTEKDKADLKAAVVRICPACGVVNPSGPSRECPHLQLVRFDGLNDELEDLLGEVAVARRKYSDLAARVRRKVLEAARAGIASVETPRRVGSGEEALAKAHQQGKGLSLVHSPPSQPTGDAAKRGKRKRSGPPAIDPRQLELIAQSPPKGDA